MHEESPISVANLFKWTTIMTLFVVCGCLFINIRSQQLQKRELIQELRREQADLKVSIQKTEFEIERNSETRVLLARLQTSESPLTPVGVDQTEDLAPEMTALR